MPDPALPQPRSLQPRAGWVLLHREYRDALGRGMTGEVTITNRARIVVDATVVPASSVRQPVIDGILEVELPPAVYELRAQLRTADGDIFTDTATATLTS